MWSTLPASSSNFSLSNTSSSSAFASFPAPRLRFSYEDRLNQNKTSPHFRDALRYDTLQSLEVSEPRSVRTSTTPKRTPKRTPRWLFGGAWTPPATPSARPPLDPLEFVVQRNSKNSVRRRHGLPLKKK